MTNCIRVPAFREGAQRELLILHIIQLVIINVFSVEQRGRRGRKATKSYSRFYPALCTHTGPNYHHINSRPTYVYMYLWAVSQDLRAILVVAYHRLNFKLHLAAELPSHRATGNNARLAAHALLVPCHRKNIDENACWRPQRDVKKGLGVKRFAGVSLHGTWQF